MESPLDWLMEPVTPRFQQPRPPNIADPYADVLRFLDEPHRRGVITLLAVGFYEGWHPTHREVAEIVRSHCTEHARRSLDRHLSDRPGVPAGDQVSATTSLPA